MTEPGYDHLSTFAHEWLSLAVVAVTLRSRWLTIQCYGPGDEFRRSRFVKGLILSGGRGNRLRPLTHSFAKQLVPVANKPVLFYGIEALVEAGVMDIGIVTGDTGAEVRAATGNGERFGARMTYLGQTEPLGLADFERGNDDATVLLARLKNVDRLGVAVVQDDRIVRLVEMPVNHISDLAVVGAYLLLRSIFDASDRIEPSPRPFTSVQDDCVIRNAGIEHSIVLQGTTIENLGTKVEDSLIGRECVIRRSPVRPSAHKLVLGDHSSVELDD